MFSDLTYSLYSVVLYPLMLTLARCSLSGYAHSLNLFALTACSPYDLCSLEKCARFILMFSVLKCSLTSRVLSCNLLPLHPRSLMSVLAYYPCSLLTYAPPLLYIPWTEVLAFPTYSLDCSARLFFSCSLNIYTRLMMVFPYTAGSLTFSVRSRKVLALYACSLPTSARYVEVFSFCKCLLLPRVRFLKVLAHSLCSLQQSAR
jgi:hypothetical protein